MIKTYNKLVRDRIPEIIRGKGDKPTTHTATDAEYKVKLNEKLKEEVEEYLESERNEELVDILEIVYTIGHLKGLDNNELEETRKRKVDEKGRFDRKTILEYVEEQDDD
ncbi:MAG TPA: nucleoside triphosphate pyrophosphohydrolase [Dehalococcoidia bacterium]|nr:nucleoside triphosphate pyrophosphohydrolase [Dehalococcoidia bacterium]